MRIIGRKSKDGKSYELWQAGTLRQTIPMAEIHASEKMKRAIAANKWEPV